MERYRGVLDLASVTNVLERGLVGEDEAGGLLSEGLDGLARLGAQFMLQVAVEQEIAEYLGRRQYEKLDGKEGILEDGSPGLIAALKSIEDWKGVPRQRCVAHKIRNVMDRLPKKEQSRVKTDIRKIFYAPTFDEAKAAVGRFLSKYGDRFPTACETLCRDIDDCLTFYFFPEAHWKRIRTSNVIERAFKEVRRRTRVVGRFPNEKSALVLMWASMEQDRLKWRGVKMSSSILQGAVQAVDQLKKTPIRIESAHKYLAVA